MNRTLTLLCANLAMLTACSAERGSHATRHHHDARSAWLDAQAAPGLENLHEVTRGVYSGGEPRGEQGFRSLSALGVRTVISTDAVAPDAELAASHGMRVVHLPIGYDGVPEQRAVELAAALRDLPGPTYIHCHHGKHRGPAAACVGAIGAGLISTDDGLAFMRRAGTSRSYPGLWRDAERATGISPERTVGVADRLPSNATPEGTPDAMAEISRAHDRLWEVQEADWIVPDDHPDLAPISDAGLIHNLLRSLRDSDETARHGHEYLGILEESIEHASSLEQALAEGDHARANLKLSALLDTCVACHSAYRD